MVLLTQEQIDRLAEKGRIIQVAKTDTHLVIDQCLMVKILEAGIDLEDKDEVFRRCVAKINPMLSITTFCIDGVPVLTHDYTTNKLEFL